MSGVDVASALKLLQLIVILELPVFLHFVQVFQLLQSVLIDGSDGFSEIPEKGGVIDIKHIGSVVVNDPWENRILWEIVVRSISKDIHIIQIFIVWDASTSPHLHDLGQVQLDQLLRTVMQVVVDIVPDGLWLEHEQIGIWALIEPHFYAYVLEHISVLHQVLHL